MIRAALYARVSSERQEQEETVQSQLFELRARLQEDAITCCMEFVDEGYWRDNLVRPSLTGSGIWRPRARLTASTSSDRTA